MMRGLWFAVAVGWMGTVGAAAADPGLVDAAVLSDGVPHLVSSADPRGGNDDRGHYVRQAGNTAVLLDARGPGVVTRIWSANPQGTLRLYFDGEAQPRWEVPFAELGRATGQAPRVAPYVSSAGGGVACTSPLPFAKSLRITGEGVEQLYYQINYLTLPAVPGGRSFRPGDRAPQRAVPVTRAVHRRCAVPAGGSAVLWQASGPGCVRELRLRLGGSPTYAELLALRLQMRFEGGPLTVDVPWLDFFACGLGAVSYESAALSVNAAGDYRCRWPLPFRRSAEVRLLNTGRRALAVEVSAAVSDAVGPRDGTFQATCVESLTKLGQPHRLADLRGRGTLVGAAVTLAGQADLKYLEGDETLTVDGQRLVGTGTEDWFDGAWYFRHGAYADRAAGATWLPGEKRAVQAYRWYLDGGVPFRQRLTLDLEHGEQNSAPGCRYRSVVYWYAASPVAVTAPAPARAATVAAPAALVAFAGDPARSGGDGCTVRRVARPGLPRPALAAAALQVVGRGTARLPVDVAAAGRYRVTLIGAGGGPELQVQGSLDGAQPRTLAPVGPGWAVGEANLSKGATTLVLTLRGGTAPVYLEGLELHPVGRVKGALEAEALPLQALGSGAQLEQRLYELGPTTVRATGVVGGAWPTEPCLSGGGAAVANLGGSVGTLVVPLDVPETADYGLVVSFLKGPEYGGVRAHLDGKPLLAGGLNLGAKVPTVGDWTPLGVHRLKQGRHRLTLTALTNEKSGFRVGIDWVMLQRANRGHEAEWLGRGDAAALGAVVKHRFGAEPRWSGGAYLRCPLGRVGATSTLRLWAPRSGRYRVTIRQAQLPTGGSFTVQLGRQTMTLDSAAPGERPGMGARCEATLDKGPNPVVLQLLSTGPGGGDAGLDVIGLEWLGLSADAVMRPLVIGLLVVGLLYGLLGRGRRRR
ncbi:MAG: DUF2961 domain-containing protein [Fimbriimonadaceae bacterium]|nr:DUF2961 domain-containing protein [Fimbriimonadaceae bacterium]